MRNPAKFWDGIATRYAARPIADMDAYEETLARARAFLNSGDKVLEVGGGTGTTALKLAPHVARIISSDISAKMVEIARGKAREERVPNADFVQATPRDAALDEGAPFDAVLAFNFLHLVEDLPATLGRLHDLVKPGGYFISKTPCLGQKFTIWPFVVPVMRLVGKAPHVAFLKTGAVDRAIRNAGFEIIEAAGIPEGKPNHFVVARKV